MTEEEVRRRGGRGRGPLSSSPVSTSPGQQPTPQGTPLARRTRTGRWRNRVTAPPPVPRPFPQARGETPAPAPLAAAPDSFSLVPVHVADKWQVPGEAIASACRSGPLVQPRAEALQQAQGYTERSGRPRGSDSGLAFPSCPTPGGGGTYCGGCGLAPSGWRRRISRPSLSTPGAGTEPPSARRQCPAASPRVRPPPTRSPPRLRPRCSRRCYCRRRRCRHCALPASPAARMRFVTPRGLGCGRVGQEAGVASCAAARVRGRCGRPGVAGWSRWVSATNTATSEWPFWGLGLRNASLLSLSCGQAGWALARSVVSLTAALVTERGGGMAGRTSFRCCRWLRSRS